MNISSLKLMNRMIHQFFDLFVNCSGGRKAKFSKGRNPFGHPLFKSIICRIIKRQAEIVDVPRITGKGLRHGHASYLLNVLKMYPLYVSHRLGHTDKSVT